VQIKGGGRTASLFCTMESNAPSSADFCYVSGCDFPVVYLEEGWEWKLPRKKAVVAMGAWLSITLATLAVYLTILDDWSSSNAIGLTCAGISAFWGVVMCSALVFDHIWLRSDMAKATYIPFDRRSG
jgi:hypothetical protein